MPTPPGNIGLVTYADDTTVSNSGTMQELPTVCQELNSYLETLVNWFEERNLFISPSKSSATIFSTAGCDANTDLPIYINNEKVPTVKKPKILGVTFDNLLSFRTHAMEVKNKVQSRNNILKALAGTSWGKEKEILVSTYKSIGQSTINYCCPIWGPNLCESMWNEIQIAQNSALRTALGCVKMTGIDHLHSECQMMPVQDHCNMLSKQFLLQTQLEDQPNSIDLTAQPTERTMKKTLSSRFGNEISNMIPPEGLDTDTYKRELKNIHTMSVQATINKQKPNPVLNQPPPKVDDTEKSLPRKARTSLSQLRSGYSSLLNSYLSRIDENVSDRCPNCHQHSHTTNHLFNCTAKPIKLNIADLWKKPVESARFLNLIEENDDNG